MSPSGKEDFAETLNFYISDSENGISHVPRQKLVEIQSELRRLAALSVPTPGTGGAEVESEATRIADAVLSWMVKFDLLDAGNEYRAEDVVAVLDDLAPIDSPAPAEVKAMLDRMRDQARRYETIILYKADVELIIAAISSSPVGEMDGPNWVDKSDVRDREDFRRASPRGGGR